jgi:fructuronate reductase
VTALAESRPALATAARLSPASLATLPASVDRPDYDRTRPATGVVHLGIGAFHRAHQAFYLDALNRKGLGSYGVTGVSLRRADVREALEPQGGLYTLVVRDGARTSYRVIGSVQGVLLAPEDPAAVLARLTDPATRLVTLTITEKGYCLVPGGHLDVANPDIVHDLATPAAPRTAVGFLVEALARIRSAGGVPPTLLSCDNLPSNGHLLRAALTELGERREAGLGRWIEANVAVPCSMIDRIVPATTERDRAEVAQALGVLDQGAVIAEPFSQWVVENRVAAGFPDFAAVGVEIVDDVAAYERMKLRLLNGCHSSIAYLGQLAGYEMVAEALEDLNLRRFVERMMADEIAPTVSGFAADQLAAYSATVIRRFENKAMRHRTWQISMDGSQKLPQRLIGTLTDRVLAGAPFERLALALAAWFRFLAGTDDAGKKIEISDPRAAELGRLADGKLPEETVVAGMLERSGLFAPALAHSTALAAALAGSLRMLRRDGAKKVLAMPMFGG